MKRIMRINFIDETFLDLEIEKATSINTKSSMISLDKMKNEKWRLIYDENLISDFTKFKNIEMIRID